MSLRRTRASRALGLAAGAALPLLLACGGGEEVDAPADETATASLEAEATRAPVEGLMSPAQAVDRQIELWEQLLSELQTIHDEASARAAAPRLSAIATEADQVSRAIDPSAPAGLGSPDQARRLEAVRDRYMRELTRITEEAPAAAPIIGEALAGGNRTP